MFFFLFKSLLFQGIIVRKYIVFKIKSYSETQKLLIDKKERRKQMKMKIIIKNTLYFELKLDVYLLLKIIGYLFIFFK